MKIRFYKYIVVGGVPFSGYTSTTTFTSLEKVGEFYDQSEAQDCMKDNFERCGGLICIFPVEHAVDCADKAQVFLGD